MTTVYLIQEVVDLGDHTVSVWFSEEKAVQDCEARTREVHRRNPYTIGREPYWIDVHVVSE